LTLAPLRGLPSVEFAHDGRNALGQRAKILTQILGFGGFRVVETYFEDPAGRRVWPAGTYLPSREVRLVHRVQRRLSPRCGQCGRRCRKTHSDEHARRWRDLPWADHSVFIEYAPVRVRCEHCKATPVEALPWAGPYDRETERLQQHLALEAASASTARVAAHHGLSWSTVRRAETAAIARWEATRPKADLRQVGVDEKYLGRRHKRDEKYVTIVSNLETGEPIWIGYGRKGETLKRWLATLTKTEKQRITLFAMDMHDPYKDAVQSDRDLQHVAVVHDPFHVMKRANQAIDELRRSIFFRAGPQMRAVGRGTRWLFLRAWERCSEAQQVQLKALLACNTKLAAAYQIKEELRGVLRAPDEASMKMGMTRILRRTQRTSNVEMRKLNESLRDHMPEILALGKYRPPVGRIEALNNNWETLVRVARGYRDYEYLRRKLAFITVNPLHTEKGVRDFLALARTAPIFAPAAA
jgi:transposase